MAENQNKSIQTNEINETKQPKEPTKFESGIISHEEFVRRLSIRAEEGFSFHFFSPETQLKCHDGANYSDFREPMLAGDPGTIMCAHCGFWKKQHAGYPE